MKIVEEAPSISICSNLMIKICAIALYPNEEFDSLYFCSSALQWMISLSLKNTIFYFRLLSGLLFIN